MDSDEAFVREILVLREKELILIMDQIHGKNSID